MSKWIWKLYSLLALTWIVICTWQVYVHERVQDSVREALFTRANDISNSLAVAIRSQGRFGVDFEPYLDAMLATLTESEDLRSIALLNSEGKISASAGEALEIDLEHLLQVGTHRDKESITFLNLVALGTEEEDLAEPLSTPALLSPGDLDDSRKGGDGYTRPGFRRPHWVGEVDYERLMNNGGVHWFVLSMSIEHFQVENVRDFWLRIAIVSIVFLAMVALGAALHILERSM